MSKVAGSQVNHESSFQVWTACHRLALSLSLSVSSFIHLFIHSFTNSFIHPWSLLCAELGDVQNRTSIK